MRNITNEVRLLAEAIGVDLSGCDNKTNLFDEGIMDSLQIALMVGEIEKKYNFSFELDDINPDVFENIASLAEYISGRIG